jgi:hypothetical protein
VAVTNEMIKGTELENASLEEIVVKSKGEFSFTNEQAPGELAGSEHAHGFEYF